MIQALPEWESLGRGLCPRLGCALHGEWIDAWFCFWNGLRIDD